MIAWLKTGKQYVLVILNLTSYYHKYPGSMSIYLSIFLFIYFVNIHKILGVDKCFSFSSSKIFDIRREGSDQLYL